MKAPIMNFFAIKSLRGGSIVVEKGDRQNLTEAI